MKQGPEKPGPELELDLELEELWPDLEEELVPDPEVLNQKVLEELKLGLEPETLALNLGPQEE